jgi:4-hydroxy-3-polyprenylbenzoate decarboxylase
MNLREYLDACGPALWRVAAPLSVVQEITALQHALSEAGRYPALLVERPRLADGATSAMAVVTNLFASRVRVAQLLGMDDHRRAAAAFARLAAAPLEPVVVSSAPVQEIVERQPDLRRLPALRQHELDLGHYVTAGHCITLDPETGVDNVSVQRCAVRGERSLTFYPYPSSHNARNVAKWEARGERCPFALWIGHHPKVVLGAQAKLSHPQSHWGAAGGIAGEPIRLVQTVTHGERLKVPADAEIVIEGFVPPGVRVADGPFAEYTGYVGVQTASHAVEVTAVTRRREALWADFGAGLEDHLVPENMAMEGRLYTMLKPLAPSLENVHVPFSGRRFHAYLQFRDPERGEVRDALAGALAYRRLRTAVAVDEDVDLFDERQVLWAIATRVQWHRDALRIDGLTHPNLDPSLPPGASTITKLGIDATLPPAAARGRPKPFVPANTVAKEALAVARRLLEGVDPSPWPSA